MTAKIPIHWAYVTDDELNQKGAGLSISYGIVKTNVGSMFIALAPKGLYRVAFIDSSQGADDELSRIKNQWPMAHFNQSDELANNTMNKILEGSLNFIPVWILATPFQKLVWKSLAEIDSRYTCSYTEVATLIGKPTATRAVASAIAKNELAYIVPCHQVIRRDGTLGGYRWGVDRKKALLNMGLNLIH